MAGISERYQQARQHIEQLQTSGADDAKLAEELERLYQEGVEFGLYANDQETSSQNLFQAVKGHYLEVGRSEQQAEEETRDLLKDKGYLVELRKWRRRYEEGINSNFDKFISDHPVSEDEKKARIRQLSERCVFISRPEENDILSSFFPGGNFLYHATQVKQAMQVLHSGELVNIKALWEKEDERIKLEGGEKKAPLRHSGFEGVTTVRQAIGHIQEENWKTLLPEWGKDRDYIGAQIESEENKITPISISVSDMFLVVPDADLNRWLKVLARCNSAPKGILVYELSKVRLENFATLHRGDNEALTRELKQAIPPSQGYIDYEQQLLGEEITSEKMAGHRKHIVGEKYLKNRKALRKNTEGNLVIS